MPTYPKLITIERHIADQHTSIKEPPESSAGCFAI